MLKSFPLKIMSVLLIMGKTFYFLIYKLIFITLHNSNSAKLKIFFHYSHQVNRTLRSSLMLRGYVNYFITNLFTLGNTSQKLF